MDYKRNEDILEVIKTKLPPDRISKLKNNWIQYVDTTQRDRLHNLLKYHKPHGLSNRRQLLKGLVKRLRSERVNTDLIL
jgi:type VI protein secretion system component VasA